jgi:hypothetical protein
MKTCPVCALDLEDTYLFCPDDGSNLDSFPTTTAKREPPVAPATESEKAGRVVVLYCPACAAEYPLTFSSCPVHDLQLTRHNIPRTSGSGLSLPEPESGAHSAAPGVNLRRDHSRLSKQLTTLDLRRPEIERPNQANPVKPECPNRIEPEAFACEIAKDFEVNPVDPPAADEFDGGASGFDYHECAGDAPDSRMERPGFRVAAIATVIALAMFGLVALYTIVSNFSRRTHSSASKTASTAQSATQPLPFVPTPQEAQDYTEETQVSEPSQQQPSEPVVERRDDGSSSSELAGRKNPAVHPLPKTPVAAPPPQPVTIARVATPPLPPLPRGKSEGFDARLIRVRSRKTPVGYRYDLTFNMQEQAGRAAHWQRVLISTRSASGASHSEAIPFSHRLGAAGALTFTISVELTGRSESDWQGRVVCTTLGWDNKGTPLQASFGANVNP